MADAAVLLDERLDVLQATIVALARRVETLERQRSRLTRADRRLLLKLLPAIGGALGSAPFMAADIVEHTSPAIRLTLGPGLTSKRLGRLLSRASGQPIGDYVVERVGREGSIVIWRVVSVSDG